MDGKILLVRIARLSSLIARVRLYVIGALTNVLMAGWCGVRYCSSVFVLVNSVSRWSLWSHNVRLVNDDFGRHDVRPVANQRQNPPPLHRATLSRKKSPKMRHFIQKISCTTHQKFATFKSDRQLYHATKLRAIKLNDFVARLTWA